MGGSIGKAINPSNIGRGLAAAASFGTSELLQKKPFGVINNPTGLGIFGKGNSSASPLGAAPGGQSPTELLSQTGGAPVLANIAMGVSAKDALAGFMGINPDQWDDYVSSLNPKDASALTSTQKQLETIQTNTDLRNKAVQNVINDFPNIAAQVAQTRQASGQEFDAATKGAISQALQGTAAKYAAGGGLSSGAMNEATARVGNDNALNRLNYMDTSGAREQQLQLSQFGARLGEVNALRDFQNTMLGRAQEQGFSANQANLGRIQQGGMANAEMANQRNIADQQSKNALFGALGGLGGTIIGGSLFGPIGAKAGGEIGGSGSSEQSGYFNQNAPKFYNTSYGKTMGSY